MDPKIKRTIRTKFGVLLMAASLLAGASVCGAQAENEQPEIMYLGAQGKEVFSRTILDPESSYLVTVTGIATYRSERHEVQADALYSTDAARNFTYAGQNVAFEPDATVVKSERATHEYAFRVNGNGHPLSAKFLGWHRLDLLFDQSGEVSGLLCAEISRIAPSPPNPWSIWFRDSMAVPWILGTLFVFAVVMIQVDEAIAERRRKDASYQEQVRIQRIERAQAAREHEARRLERWRLSQEEACRGRFRAACLRFEIRKHLGDEGFLADYARKNKDKILAERGRIIENYQRLHEDAVLISMLQRDRPEIYRIAIWEMKALNLAERFDVERPEPKPLPVLVPKRKPSPEEFRDRMIRRERTRSWDKIEKSRTRLEGIIEARKMLDEFDLDSDERARLEGEVIGQIIDDEDPNGPNAL